MVQWVANPAQARIRRDRLNLALWTVQGWLAMFYAGTGYAKASQPIDNLVLLMGFPAGLAPELMRTLGGLDILLALAMLLPLLSWKIGWPALAAAALVMIASQLALLAYYAIDQEWGLSAVNLALLAMTAVVFRLRGRWRVEMRPQCGPDGRHLSGKNLTIQPGRGSSLRAGPSRLLR